MASTSMEIIITAIDRASAVFQKIQNNISEMEQKTKHLTTVLDKVGKSLAILGAGATAFSVPFVAAMKSAIQTGIDFEQEMYKIKAITGASASDFQKLTQVAMQLGQTTAYTSSQVAEAMYQMASAGLKTKEIIASLPAVLNLATVAQTNLATATDLVISTLNSFGLSAQKASQVVDVFVQACANSPATVEKLQLSLKYAAPAARALGLNLQQTVAALMMFYNAGRKGEEAGTALREVLTSLADPKVQKALEQYGIKVMDASGKLRNLGDILDDIKKKGLSASQVFQIFGTEAGSAILTLTQQGGDAYKKFVEILDNANGVAKKKAEEMKNTVWYKIQELKSAIEGIKLTIFKDSKGDLKKFLDELIKAMPAIKEFAVAVAQGFGTVGRMVLAVVVPLLKFFQALPGPVKKAIGVFVGLAAAIAMVMGPLLLLGGAIAAAISSIIEVISVIGALGSALGALSGVVATAVGVIGSFVVAALPIIAVIAAIGLAVAALYLAWKNNWFGIRNIVASVVKKVKEILKGFIDGIKWIISKILENKNAIKNALFTALLGPFAPLKIAWDKNLFGIRDKLKNAINNLISFLHNHKDTIKKAFFYALVGPFAPLKYAWDKNLFSIRDKLKKACIKMLNYLKSLPHRFYEAGVAIITEFKKGIESKINEIKQKILDLLNWIDRHLPHSPAKEGPLSRLDKVGPGFVDTIAEGIEKHKSKLQYVVGELATIMYIHPRGITNIAHYDGDTHNTITVNINVVGKSYDEHQLARFIALNLKKQLYR